MERIKQHIIKEQWNELSKEEQKVFIDNFKTILGVPIWESITIGQMIEYLGDNYISALIDGHLGELEWECPAKDVCSKLWELVKYKVKQNN